MTINYAIDPVNEIELVEIIQPNTNFLEKIFIDNKNQALKEARNDHAGLVI